MPATVVFLIPLNFPRSFEAKTHCARRSTVFLSALSYLLQPYSWWNVTFGVLKHLSIILNPFHSVDAGLSDQVRCIGICYGNRVQTLYGATFFIMCDAFWEI